MTGGGRDASDRGERLLDGLVGRRLGPAELLRPHPLAGRGRSRLAVDRGLSLLVGFPFCGVLINVEPSHETVSPAPHEDSSVVRGVMARWPKDVPKEVTCRVLLRVLGAWVGESRVADRATMPPHSQVRLLLRLARGSKRSNPSAQALSFGREWTRGKVALMGCESC